MEEFNFSSLIPIQQDVPSNMMNIVNSSSPLILSSQPQGCDLNSTLFNMSTGGGGKEIEDTTMYITVDTGPPGSNIIPLLNNSPPSVSSLPTTTNVSNLTNSSFKSDDNIVSTNDCNATIASLMIDSDATGSGITNYSPSTINHQSKPSTIFVDNISSLGTQSSIVPTIAGLQCSKPQIESITGSFNISPTLSSSEPSGTSSLFCGECSVNLPSSGDFFEHWVTHHCQLLQPSNPLNIESSLQLQTNLADAATISSDEIKNLIISGNSIGNSSAEPSTAPSYEAPTTGLVMERCSVCNHIFVQGTDRHKQHSLAGPCVLNPHDLIESRHNVDTVNNNNPTPSLRIMVPLKNEKSKVDFDNDCGVNLYDPTSNTSILPALSEIVTQTNGNKKRKFGGLSPKTTETFERNIAKKMETSTISSNNKNCVCGVCNASVKTITSYFLHWLERHQDDLSNKKQTPGDTAVERTSTANILQEVWQCRACPNNVTKLFPNCVMLSSHVKSEHEGLNRTERNNETITSSCQITFQCKEYLDKHEKSFHQVNDNNSNSLNNVNPLMCPLCDKNVGVAANDNGMSLCKHYREEHVVRCKGRIFYYLNLQTYGLIEFRLSQISNILNVILVCQVDLENGDQETTHYLAVHKGEMVWSRKDRLKLISSDTVIRSKILSGAQKPTRLANGAIAKSLQGVTAITHPAPPPAVSSWNENTIYNATILEGCKTTNDLNMDTPSSSKDLEIVSQTQMIAPMSSQKHSTQKMYSQDAGCSPEKRKKLGEVRTNKSVYPKPFDYGINNGNAYSGKATIIASKVLPSHTDPIQIKGI